MSSVAGRFVLNPVPMEEFVASLLSPVIGSSGSSSGPGTRPAHKCYWPPAVFSSISSRRFSHSVFWLLYALCSHCSVLFESTIQLRGILTRGSINSTMGGASGAVRCAKCGRPMYYLCIPRMSGDRGPSVSRQARPSQSNETPVGPIAGAVRVDPSRRRPAARVRLRAAPCSR